MPSAVLRIDGDVSGLTRALGDARAQARATERAVASAYAGMTQAAERSARTVATVADRSAGAYRRNARGLRDDSVRASRESEVAAARAVQAYLRGEEQKRRASRLSAQARERAEREASEVARAEARRRGLSAEQEAHVRQRALEGLTRSYETSERRMTAAARREQRERDRAAASPRSAANLAVRGAVAVASGAASAAGGVHASMQEVREQRAQRETALNNILLQLVPSGADANEVASLRSQIMQGARRARLDPDAVIEAVGGAQSFANALGGDTAAQRRANTAATLRDVEFASVIDPTSMGGLVRLGALTRGRMGDRDRQDLLRSFAGISFQGSVETDEAITRGLPGLQEAWSTATAGITDPAEASRRRLEVARDFAAQIQSQAASGRSVTVAANRTNTVRNALANEHRQDELGRAFAARQRTMTAEQRAAFDSSFTRDAAGHYRMNEAVRGRASDAARFFGTMFNNDAGAMRNFLGAHGGGGARQLMNRPDVDALASYFATATNARGEQVRQYDYVNELARSTITPEQEATMRSVRESEDSRKLTEEREGRAAALGENTAALRRLSDSITGIQSRNPIAAPVALAAGGVGARILGSVGARAIPFVGAAMSLLGLGSDLNAGVSTGRAAANFAGDALAGGAAINGVLGRGSLAEAARLAPAGPDAARVSTGGAVREVGGEMARLLADLNTTLRGGITASITPTDAAQTASRAPAPGR